MDKKIYKLTGEENYWLLSAGKTPEVYDTFRDKNIIGLAWDKIKLSDIEKNSKNSLKRIVEEKYKAKLDTFKIESSSKRAVTFIINKLELFTKKMKKGDIVIVKDSCKSKVMFGIIESDCYPNDNPNLNLFIDEEVGKCNKLRDVTWIKILTEDQLLPQLKFVLQSRHAINKIESIQGINEINRTMFSLFELKDQTHAIFKINKAEDILFSDYFNFLEIINNSIIDSPDAKTLKIKSNISSPGPLEIIGKLEEVTSILIKLGILGVGIRLSTPVLKEKYESLKNKLNITSPGEKDDFTEGN